MGLSLTKILKAAEAMARGIFGRKREATVAKAMTVIDLLRVSGWGFFVFLLVLNLSCIFLVLVLGLKS